MRLATEVAFVKPVAAGEGVSYGLRHHVDRTPSSPRCRSATPTVSSVRWGCSARRCSSAVAVIPWSASVTMDQVMVDVGPDSDVQPGDEVVLLGAQGEERISPDEWAAARHDRVRGRLRLGT